jgi:hypothetical protein
LILANYTIWDGLSQKTISRYCPFKDWRKSEISDLVEPEPSEEPLAGVRAALVQVAGQHAVVPDPQQNQVTDKNKTVSMTN